MTGETTPHPPPRVGILPDTDPALLERIPPAWRDQIAYPRLIDGRLCAVQKFIFTTALLVDVKFDDFAEFYDYGARYCYPQPFDALLAIVRWDGAGDPPGPWVKEKVSERLGPGALGDGGGQWR